MTYYTFRPRWKTSLLFLASLILFIQLGFWQLRRAEEKEALTEMRHRRSQESPMALYGGMVELSDLRYRRVQIVGEYDAEHSFLLDNQLMNRQPGYHVLTPFKIKGTDHAILVDRGWVPLGVSRNKLPEVSIQHREALVLGIIDDFPRVGFQLKNAEIPRSGWPSVVLVIERAQIARRLDYTILPYRVLLDPNAEDGYVRMWLSVPLDASKNRGYALQWFLFAAVAVLLYGKHSVSRRTILAQKT